MLSLGGRYMNVHCLLFYFMPENLKIKEKNLQKQELTTLCSFIWSQIKFFPSTEGKVPSQC